MAKYELSFNKSVANDLQRIPNNKDVKRILSRIEELADYPTAAGCVKLSGLERYRVRQGLYPIIYEIQDDRLVVHVMKVGHRSDVYKSN